MNQVTIWQVIDSISKQHPFTKERIESILSIRLEAEKSNINPFFNNFIGENLHLMDGIIVSSINFYFKKSDPNIAEVGLNDITGACITLEQVRGKYSSLTFLSAPRGESPLEKWTYEVPTPWGRLTFGFKDKETKPDCLAYVGFGLGNK